MTSSSNWVVSQKKLESNAFNFVILSCSVFNSAFVATVAILLSKSALSMDPALADLLTDPLLFILLVKMSLVNLL